MTMSHTLPLGETQSNNPDDGKYVSMSFCRHNLKLPQDTRWRRNNWQTAQAAATVLNNGKKKKTK